MASITTRAGKGSPLTNAEVDANFTNLNTELGQKLTANQNITVSGDATGSGTTSIALTLANSGVSAGTYGSATDIPQIAVDAKGRITSVSNVAVSIPSGSLTFTGDVTGTGSTGSSTALTLANSGVTAGTYTKVTVDAKGRVTVGASLASEDLPTYTGTLTSSQVTTALGYTPVNRAGDTITGRLGIGSGSVTADVLRVVRNIDGAASANGVLVDGPVQSDVTTRASYFRTVSNTQATAFTLTTLNHYEAAQNASFGAGSAVTTQVGFRVDPTLVGATTNIGFRGGIPSGTGRWNLFMDGTASNHLAGPLAINTTFLNDYLLRVGGNMSGAATRGAVEVNSTAQSDVTSEARGIVSAVSTAAASFTVGQAAAFFASQGTVGAGSAITTQVGFLVGSGFIGGGNNYGFRGAIPSGANRFNLYMDGTASNFLGGNLIVNAPLGFGAAGSPSYGTSGQFLKSAGNAAAPTWGSLTSGEVTTALGFTPISGNQTITLSGDASGTGTTAITLSLANSGVSAGTYTKVTVDAKGRVTSGTTLASADLPTYTGTLTSSQVTTALGFTPYNSTNPNGYTSNTGTVTSVSGAGTVSGLTLTGTVTTTGSLTLGGTLSVTPSNFASQTANTFLAAPNGTAGTPTFRAIVAADIPTLNQNTTGTAANVTGTVALANGGTGSTTAAGARTNLGATTVGSNLFTLASPSAVTFLRVNADNTVSTLDAATFRSAIGAGTSSTTGTVTSVSGTGTVSGLTLTGTVTSSGSLTLGGTLSLTSSQVTTALGYTPPQPNGTGASGTWGISISGTATTATTANALNTANNYQVNSLGVGTAASGTAGEIRATNNITAYFSDDRLKTRLGAIENALDKVASLESFYYQPNETAQALGYAPVREVGISAQQVQAVLPEVVAPAPIDDKYLTVRYERMVPLLLAAINELRAEVNVLKGAH